MTPRGGLTTVNPRLVIWLGVAVLALYLVFIGGGWWGIYRPDLRAISVAVAGSALVAWAALCVSRPSLRPRSQLAVPIVLAIFAMLLSTAFSRDPRIGAEYVGYAILLGGLYLLLVRLLADDFLRPRIVVLASFTGVGIAVVYLLLTFVDWSEWWATLGRFTVPPLRPNFQSLTFGNPSAVLTMVCLLALPVLSSIDLRRTSSLLISGMVIALDAAVIVISGSRGGWFGIAMAVAVTAGLWLAMADHRRVLIDEARRIWSRRSLRVTAIVSAMVVLIVGSAATPALASRLTAGGEDLRAGYVVVALRLFATSPITGTGPGTWVIDRISQTATSETDYYIPHAHNLEAQTLAELGLVGIGVGAVAVLFLGRLLRASIRSTDPGTRRWGWLAILGTLYFAFHQQLDFYANMPAALFAYALPIAYLDAASTATGAPVRHRFQWVAGRVSRSRPARLGLVLVIGLVAAGLLAQEYPAMQEQAGVALADAGDWEAATGHFAVAASLDPDVMPYRFAYGLALARAGNSEDAVVEFDVVAERTDWPEAWLNLAAEQQVLGETAAAHASLIRALRLGIQRPAVAMPGGSLALALGDASLAVRAFATAVAQVPSLAADPWWKASPQAHVFDAVIADAKTRTAFGWEIALMAGDVQEAAYLAGDGIEARNFIGAWNGDPGAAMRVYETCGSQPLNIEALVACARIEARQGNVTLSDAYAYLANVVNGGSGAEGAELRVAASGSGDSPMQGAAASFWGTYTYRRGTPADLLAPTLLHLKLVP